MDQLVQLSDTSHHKRRQREVQAVKLKSDRTEDMSALSVNRPPSKSSSPFTTQENSFLS